MSDVFPESKLAVLPLDHRVYTFGRDPQSIQYREVVKKEHPELTGPSLEGVTVDGNTVVFYSRFALGCFDRGPSVRRVPRLHAPGRSTLSPPASCWLD